MIVNLPCLLSCYCQCSVAVACGAMDWSAVCDCAITDHTHLLLKALTKKTIDSIAQFGTHCICLTNVHRSNRYEALKQLIFVAKKQGS